MMGRMVGQAVLKLCIYRCSCDMTLFRQIATVSSVSAVSTGQLLHRRHLVQDGVGGHLPLLLRRRRGNARPPDQSRRRDPLALASGGRAFHGSLRVVQTSILPNFNTHAPPPLTSYFVIILFARDRFSDLSPYTAATSTLQLLPQQSSSSTLKHTQDKQDGRHQEGACHQQAPSQHPTTTQHNIYMMKINDSP